MPSPVITQAFAESEGKNNFRRSSDLSASQREAISPHKRNRRSRLHARGGDIKLLSFSRILDDDVKQIESHAHQRNYLPSTVLNSSKSKAKYSKARAYSQCDELLRSAKVVRSLSLARAPDDRHEQQVPDLSPPRNARKIAFVRSNSAESLADDVNLQNLQSIVPELGCNTERGEDELIIDDSNDADNGIFCDLSYAPTSMQADSAGRFD